MTWLTVRQRDRKTPSCCILPCTFPSALTPVTVAQMWPQTNPEFICVGRCMWAGCCPFILPLRVSSLDLSWVEESQQLRCGLFILTNKDRITACISINLYLISTNSHERRMDFLHTHQFHEYWLSDCTLCSKLDLLFLLCTSTVLHVRQ